MGVGMVDMVQDLKVMPVAVAGLAMVVRMIEKIGSQPAWTCVDYCHDDAL